MLRTLSRYCAVFLLAASVSGAVHADEAVEQLVKNARYWQERGRADKAADAWRRVLVADPKNADALVEVGTYQSRQGRLDKAQEYLARLREVSPQHPGVATLERALATGAGFDEWIARARKLAAAGKPVEAVAAYRQAIGAGDPPDDLALEYYQTMGGTPAGWDDAARGLERLVTRTGTPRAKLALAKHLTYREKTRRQGIARLRELAAEPSTAAEAAPAWRQALLWLQVGPGDGELFAAYLAVKGHDAEIAKKAEDAKKVASRPGASPAKAGFEALERADVDEAGRIFDRAAKSHRKDPQVLVGQGVVALQQQDFARAREIFTKVKAMAPDRPELWERSLRSAQFWTVMREAETLVAGKHYDDADRKLVEAARISPEERIYADVAHADLLRERGALADAEAALHPIVESDPKNVAAQQALLRVYIAGQKVTDAEETNTTLAALDPGKALPPEVLRAGLLRSLAGNERQSGLLDKARGDLLAATKADPRNAEAVIDLAYIDLELDDLAAAHQALEALVKLSPKHTEVTHLRVRLLEAEKHYPEALQLIATLPPAGLDDSLRALKERLEIRTEAARLVSRGQRGARAGSRLRLLELERRAAGHPELMLIVAESWGDLNDRSRALLLAHQVAAHTPEMTVGARLQLAAVYLRADSDPDLEELLRDLATEPTLSRRERGDLDRLRVARSVRRADRLRDKGELESALAEIAPLLRESPDNPRLLCALGRIFHTANENGEGNNVFMRVLRQDPDDLEARQGAIETAVGMHDLERARRLTDEALQRSPGNARVHLLAGRFSVLVGDDAAAADSFRAAQEILSHETGGPGTLITALAMDRSTSDVLDMAALKLGARASDSSEGDLPLEVQTEVDRLNAKRSVDVRADFIARNRDGYGGLAGLTELRIPVTATVPTGYRGRLSLTAAPVVLDTGSVGTDRTLTQRFGTLGLDPSTVPQDGLGRSVSGAQLGLAYTHRWLSLDVGSTPLGLPLQTVVGGASLHGQVGRVGLAASGSRRSITDSMLSYVGMKDPATGLTWGRVLNDGGRLDLSVNTEPALFYVFGGGGRITGHHVAQNQMFMGGTGVEWSLYDFDDTSFATGLGLTYLTYDKNLRYFTYGQGGYFSPQQFVHAGIPVKGHGTAGNSFRWEIVGDLGLNWFREAQSPYFPKDPDLQAARASLVDPMGVPAEAAFDGQRNLSLAFDFTARAAYQLTPQLETGLQAAVRRADYFREVVGGLYVQLNFRRNRVNRPSGL